MLSAAVSLALSGLGRDALKFAIGLVVALVIGIAFTVASVVVVIASLAMPVGPPPSATPVVGPPSSARGTEVVALARSEIGVPYVWGGASPTGFDCSGLVQWAYAQVGVSLPRTAQEQYDATTRISPDQLRPGDLVYFSQTYEDPSAWVTHVGIYLGGGLMINAPTDGDVVRTMPVFEGFWGAHYAGAGRIGG